MNDSKIKVLLVEPEKYPKEIVIDDSLEAMQEIVGGDIEEYMPFDDDVAIIKTKYSIEGEEGTIALIGPKRMEYGRVTTLLNFIKENIENDK